MSISTAIILDNLGTFAKGPDKERDDILEELRKDGLDIDLRFYGHLFSQLPQEQGYDLVIVDYGALWQMNMEDQSKLVVQWAEDHPGSLVMLWSTLTVEMIVDDVLSPFDDSTGWYKKAEFPHNLRPYHAPNTLRNRMQEWEEDKWIYGDKFLKSWFGVKK